MCGICGIIKFDQSKVEKHLIERMVDKIRHRGPNDHGIYTNSCIGLGSTRLSILDLSPAGHMPMYSDDGRYVIIYNGEIYNYIELKDELKSSFKFRSHTDTEVILNSYRKWGVDCLQHFNGMFAFMIYDIRDNLFFAARDRFGIKPFYYYKDEKKFIFASEITPILSVLDNSILHNNDAIYDLMVFNQTNQTENTFFQGIKKLQHANYILIKENKVSIYKWYDLNTNLKAQFNNPMELEEQLSRSLGLRLRSDVPVGACLSGGLDSSSLVSLVMNDYGRNDINTFSSIFEKGMKGDESTFIELYRDKVKNMHFIKPTEETLLNDLETFIFAQSEPVPTSSAYSEFKVMELAKDYVTVILNGQGADEEFAGYDYFFGFYFKELLQSFNMLQLSRELYYYLLNHKSIYGVKAMLYLLLPSDLKSSLRAKGKHYLVPEFTNKYYKDSRVVNAVYDSSSLHNALIDHFENKFEHHLIWGDRSSMWFSLELRFPFLDHHLVEKALSLGNKDLINNGMTKSILRKAMIGKIPDKIVNRKDKVGFETPEEIWFRKPKMKELILDLINSKSFSERGYINKDKANLLYKRHLVGDISISADIWKWINLELWFQKFIDQKLNN